ncbi:MAG: ribosome small subunit-dependent GTPase A [Oligoflexus sp.]
MAKWKFRGIQDTDELAKYDKIRRGRDKRKKSKSDDAKFELPESSWDLSQEGWFRARVVEVQKRYAFIAPEPVAGELDSRDVWLATVARKYLQSKRLERNTICVGDVVLCRPTDEKEADIETDIPCCVINNMAPRTSKISRKDPLRDDREHVLASNVDQLLIVASYQSPLVKWGLIDRYLVLAEEQEIPAVIILNKSDLLAAESVEFQERCQQEIETYRNLGYPVFSIAAEFMKKNDPDLKEIKKLLEGKVTILSGHSGVGKSSLVNRFRPEIIQEVEPNSEIFYKGRHTTTYASFIKLGTGGSVIDTPGIRSFLLGDRSAIDLTHGFRELRPFMGKCKFRECRHIDEPGCAVLQALADGLISERRYRSYVGLLLGDTGREGRTRDDNLNET